MGPDDNDDGMKDDGEVREQDRFLPVANIARIMKTVLPANAKIAKDAKETIQECVSEFISFITSEASDKCLQEKRKTINGDDLLWAMSTLGFDRYIEPLKTYLGKYREAVKGDRPEKKPSNRKSNDLEPGTFTGLLNHPSDLLAGGFLEESAFYRTTAEAIDDGSTTMLRKRDTGFLDEEAMPKKTKY